MNDQTKSTGKKGKSKRPTSKRAKTKSLTEAIEKQAVRDAAKPVQKQITEASWILIEDRQDPKTTADNPFFEGFTEKDHSEYQDEKPDVPPAETQDSLGHYIESQSVEVDLNQFASQPPFAEAVEEAVGAPQSAKQPVEESVEIPVPVKESAGPDEEDEEIERGVALYDPATAKDQIKFSEAVAEAAGEGETSIYSEYEQLMADLLEFAEEALSSDGAFAVKSAPPVSRKTVFDLPIPKKAGNRVRGALLGSRFAFAEQRWGEEAKQLLIESFPAGEKKKLESQLFENMWFDFSILDTLDRVIVKELAKGDKSILRQLGRFSAEHSFYRLPEKLISSPPEIMLQSTARINVIFQDFGEFQVEALPEIDNIRGVALIYRYEIEIPESRYCLSALGYFERLLELAGHRVVEVKESLCQTRGDFEHRYECWWRTADYSEPVTAETTQRMTADDTLRISQDLTAAGQRTSGQYKQQKSGTGRLSGTGKLSGAYEPITKPTQKSTATLSAKSSDTSKPPANALPAKNGDLGALFNMRVKVLLALIGLAVFVAAGQWLYGLATKTKELPPDDIIHTYLCTGSLEPTIRVDKPHLYVKTDGDWNDVKITAERGGKEYYYITKQLKGAEYEISLGEFLSSTNKALNADAPPTNFSVSVILDGQVRSCICRLEK